MSVRCSFEHLDDGPCAQCDVADDPDDDQQFRALLDRYGHLQFQVLRRRAEAGDQKAEAEINELRFQALMRAVRGEVVQYPATRLIQVAGFLFSLS